MKIWVLIITAVVIYFIFSSPERVVVNESGEVKGVFNQIRSDLQGKDFWSDQAQEVKKELQEEQNEPVEDAELKKELDKIDADNSRDMEDLYREFPDMRPSEKDRLVEKLRSETDRIEEQEFDRSLKEDRVQRINELRRILTTVESHLMQKSYKKQPTTFKERPCTVDCSGHKAGYDWAAKKGINNPDDCGGKSSSFIEGCKAYVADQ